MLIKSLQHELVKHLRELRKSSKLRQESKTVLLIGEKMIREFPFPIEKILSIEPNDIRAETKYLVTQEILEKISGIKGFDGILAEVTIPKEQDVEDKNFVLILDQIQDPGNLGTILRSCLALGWEGVIATPGTVDFFNDKALRASRGAIFRLPFCYKTPEQIVELKHTLYVADIEGENPKGKIFQGPLSLILSNEGHGLSTWVKQKAKPLTIPMHYNVESLNVATAGSILLYQMKPS